MGKVRMSEAIKIFENQGYTGMARVSVFGYLLPVDNVQGEFVKQLGRDNGEKCVVFYVDDERVKDEVKKSIKRETFIEGKRKELENLEKVKKEIESAKKYCPSSRIGLTTAAKELEAKIKAIKCLLWNEGEQ